MGVTIVYRLYKQKYCLYFLLLYRFRRHIQWDYQPKQIFSILTTFWFLRTVWFTRNTTYGLIHRVKQVLNIFYIQPPKYPFWSRPFRFIPILLCNYNMYLCIPRWTLKSMPNYEKQHVKNRSIAQYFSDITNFKKA